MTFGRLSVIAVLAAVLGTMCCSNSDSQELAESQIAEMKALQDRIDNTIRERGVIESSKSVEVRCDVKGDRIILSLVPEGARVSKGDLLVELEDSALRQLEAEAEIATKQAMAGLQQANSERKAAQVEKETVVQVLEGELKIAELEQQKVLGDGGELAYQLATAEGELATAQNRLAVARGELQISTGERRENSDAELQLMRFEEREAVKIAEARVRYLKEHERPYQMALLDGAITQKRLELKKQQAHLQGALDSAEAQLLVEQAKVAAAQEKLGQIQEQINGCRVVAPQAGVVIHATDSRESIGIGATVSEQQSLVRICDLTSMQARVLVNESRISRVRVGQPARIVCDALPDKVFHGRVVQVSDVPEPSSWRTADVKEYKVIVSINEPSEALRIGLTTLVEIDASEGN